MSVVWLVLASLVWTGLIAGSAEWIAGASVRPHFAQGVWRGAAALMALPWLAAFICALWPTFASTPLPTLDAVPGAAGAAMTAIGGAETALETSAGPTIGRVLMAVLAAGWIVRLACGVRAQARLQSIKRMAMPADGRSDSAAWAGALGLRRVPDIRAIPSGSPFVAGTTNPKIYLPECIRDDETRRLVIAHECVHLSRGDLLTRQFERGVADLLWFSPFAWLARRRLDYLREAVCDAETVALTGERTGYARALTNVARAVRPVEVLPVSGFIPRRKKALSMRVRGIVEGVDPKPNRPAAALAGMFALIAAPIAIAQGIALEAEANKTHFSHVVVLNEKARVSSAFGWRTWNGEDKLHEGVDIAAPKGSIVYAPADGKIAYIGTAEEQPSFGNSVSMYLSDGRKMRFASLDEVKVEVGAKVWAGDAIGTVGKSAKNSTGPHVHVELWKLVDDGETHEPLDPAEAGVKLCESPEPAST